MKTLQVTEWTRLILLVLDSKGHNSRVPGWIGLVVELGKDIIPTNIITKTDEYPIETDFESGQ